MSTSPRTQEARREATRGALVAAARRLFVERGYAATGTPELVAAAGVTRGALYHHFEDKSDLLMAVAADMAVEVAEAVAKAAAAPAAAPAADRAPLDALLAGSRAYFAAMAEGGRARVLLVDAPAVLAPAQLALLDEAAGAAELRAGLQACVRRGRKLPLDALTGLLSAAFDRAARAVAEGEDPAAWTEAMDLLLKALAGELGR